MTAPAVAQINRPTLAQLPPQSPRQASSSAKDTRESTSFAAHLERGTHDRVRTARPPANDTRTPTATLRAARPDTASPAASRSPAAKETATGKTLPDKRQNPAETRDQSSVARLAGQAVAEDQAAHVDTATPEIEVDRATATDSILPLPMSLMAALPSPSPSLPEPARATGLQQTSTSARLGAAPQINAASGPTASTTAGLPQPSSDRPATNQLATVPGTAAPMLAVPAAAFLLEREAAAAQQATTDPTAAPIQPGAVQNAARAESSTFAALNGASDMDATSARKARRDIENGLPATKTGAQASSAQIAADLTASALPQAQPFAISANADPAAPASSQPAEGIGFDALVDSIARARDGAATDGTTVSMRHADFGRVSLRFQAEADGLSVAMTSADPAFAPAVAAARAAEAAATASTDAGQRQTPTSSSSDQSSERTGSSQTQSGGQNGAQGGGGQQRASATPARNSPLSTSFGTEAPANDGHGGIFA